ncbi:MAG: TetR/AcrR family transcriptional regulator, partial [Bacteroidetes bacterium]|nr:TetR/AcrR family transcriptional regulator [Bacteroidota bacterium]
SKGVLATRLQDVAEHLDVAYTALYHYFPGRDRLAEEVLLWRLEKRHQLLTEVSGESALVKLLSFFKRELTEDRDYQVRFPPFSALPEENRHALIAKRNVLLAELTSLIDEGVSEGSVRTCHSLTVANAVLGIIERFVYFDDAVSARMRQMAVKRVVSEMTTILEEGILRDRSFVPRPSYIIEQGKELLSYDPSMDPELERLESILRVATRRFNIEGAAASIPKIAEELGVSKTVIYRYVLDKQELLFQCYLRGVSVVEISHRIASDTGRDPLDEILIHRHGLYRYHDSEVGPFTFISARGFLHPSQQRVVALRNRAVRRMSEVRMQRGINAGQIRSDIDAEVVQPMFGQILYTLPTWYSDDYPLTIEEVCSQTGNVLFQGLKR